MAAAIPEVRCGRNMRRVAPGAPPPDQRRACGAVGAQDPGDETKRRYALEYPANRSRDTRVEIDGAPYLAGLWIGAAPPETLQALDGSIFCRKSTGYCRAVFKSPGKCCGFVRR